MSSSSHLPGESIRLHTGELAWVDACDAHLVRGRKWHAKRGAYTTYARTRLSKGVFLYLHQLILPDVPQIDHKDGDGLNCRRDNLRPATRGQNSANVGIKRNNATGYKGVYQRALTGTFTAQVTHQGKVHTRAGFKTEEEASDWATQQRARLHGEFARDR